MARFPQSQFTESEVIGALKEADGNQARAAARLGVSQAWVTKWLNRNGYVRQVTWVKREQQPA